MKPLPHVPPEATPGDPPLTLGVSACLVGEEVRSNGGHARDDFLVRQLGPWVRFVTVCPEAELGMGTPRETVRLVGDPAAPRMVGTKSRRDWTADMTAWAEARADGLASAGLDGFVLKKASPSCGLLRVRLYDVNGVPSPTGQGLWARALERRFPWLPIEEEGRLHDPRLRENFIERLFVFRRWRLLLAAAPAIRDLVAFHAAHKLALLAHSPARYRELGRLAAQHEELAWDERLARYGALLMESLRIPATPGRHANVLEHLLGFVKDALPSRDKAELLALVADHRRGLVPLIVPLTLLRHHLDRHPVPDWIRAQTYLHPYPRELMLRNHV
jgi:uncharacterized protein YbgA (DUF1722 family)/uncharacterized protein YbbK (DUF523 family)